MRHLTCDESGVGVAETVDTLFGVADYHILVALALVDERLHVYPLKQRRVLELVYHVRFQHRADFLIYERHIAALVYLLQNGVGVGKLHNVVAHRVVLYVAQQQMNQRQHRNGVGHTGHIVVDVGPGQALLQQRLVKLLEFQQLVGRRKFLKALLIDESLIRSESDIRQFVGRSGKHCVYAFPQMGIYLFVDTFFCGKTQKFLRSLFCCLRILSKENITLIFHRRFQASEVFL